MVLLNDSFASLSIQSLRQGEVIMLRWGSKVRKDMRQIFRVIPNFILWKLWKKRNTLKHEGRNTSLQRIMHNITRNTTKNGRYYDNFITMILINYHKCKLIRYFSIRHINYFNSCGSNLNYNPLNRHYSFLKFSNKFIISLNLFSIY